MLIHTISDPLMWNLKRPSDASSNFSSTCRLLCLTCIHVLRSYQHLISPYLLDIIRIFWNSESKHRTTYCRIHLEITAKHEHMMNSIFVCNQWFKANSVVGFSIWYLQKMAISTFLIIRQWKHYVYNIAMTADG